MLFNINDYVRVRLTDLGRRVHREHFVKLMAGTPYQYEPPKEDESGWSKWQLWDLMQEFGPYVRMGGPVPFETTIEIVEPATAQGA